MVLPRHSAHESVIVFRQQELWLEQEPRLLELQPPSEDRRRHRQQLPLEKLLQGLRVPPPESPMTLEGVRGLPVLADLCPRLPRRREE